MSEIRDKIVEEAMSWLRTPWHHRGRIKGAGVDCAQFLCAVYEEVGLTPHIDLGYYPIDWHMHQDRSRFLEKLLDYAELVESPMKGDIAMFRFARHPAHGSIVIEWPKIIHAYTEARCVTLDDATKGRLPKRQAGFYRLKGLV